MHCAALVSNMCAGGGYYVSLIPSHAVLAALSRLFDEP